MDGKKLRQNRQMQIRVCNSETTRLTYTGYPKGIRSLYSSSSKNNLLVAYFRSVNHQLAFFLWTNYQFHSQRMCSHGAHESQNWTYVKQSSSRCEEGLPLSLIEFVQVEEEEKVNHKLAVAVYTPKR